MRKWIIILVLIVMIIIAYNYIYKEHRNIEKENAEFVLTSNNISSEFSQNSIEAEKKYLNKTIEIKGLISEVNTKDITIDNSVFCQFNDSLKSTIKIKDDITIKGRCIGYDDLLELVKIDQSTIIE